MKKPEKGRRTTSWSMGSPSIIFMFVSDSRPCRSCARLGYLRVQDHPALLTMRDQGIHLLRTVISERASGQRKGVPGIYHVIDQDRNLEAHRTQLIRDRQNGLDTRCAPCHVHPRPTPPSSPGRPGSACALYESTRIRLRACPQWRSPYVIRQHDGTCTRIRAYRGIGAQNTHRFAPPASGLTMMLFRQSSMFLLIYEIMSGSE